MAPPRGCPIRVAPPSNDEPQRVGSTVAFAATPRPEQPTPSWRVTRSTRPAFGPVASPRPESRPLVVHPGPPAYGSPTRLYACS